MTLHRMITTPGIYFITFTCYNWISLIELVKGYDLVYKWFDILVAGGHSIVGYVIMPNHIHMLLHYSGQHQSLNSIIGNGKRFLAYDIIKQLKKEGNKKLISQLGKAVKKKDQRRGKQHEVWKYAFDAKECWTDDFTFQKLQYIHNNPCNGRWKLANSIIDYPHSSALYYITGQPGNYSVRDYREFLTFDEE